jgi:hypothetical protein
MNKFYLYKSDKPTKKYYVEFENPDSKKSKKIYFGAAGYPDFILSGDEEKKKRYIARHKKRENWSSPYAGAGVWARYILWGERTLPKSIKAMEKHFNIKIINRTNRKAAGEKPSAYRSMKLAKLGLTKPTTKANRGALLDWTRQKWLNLTALLTDKKELACGTKGKKQKELGLPSVCRPSVRTNKKTPMLAKEFSNKQIKKAIELKKKGKRINWKEL